MSEVRSGRLAARVFAAVLRLYPGAFRDRFGRSMQDTFGDEYRRSLERAGRGAALRAAGRNIANGLSGAVAERIAARREAGHGYEQQGRRRELSRLIAGLRQGARRLRRAPTFTVITVLSVAFGVATFGSILSVVDGVLLEDPPYRDVERLEWVWRDYTWADFPRGWLGGPDIALLRERTEAFEAVVGFDSDRANLTASDGGSAEEVRLILATDDFFDVIGVQPLFGRGFAPGESDSTATQVVVLSHELWQRRFGSDRGVVGGDVFLDGQPKRVIGVMPPGFRFVMHASLADPMPADVYEVLQTNLGAASPGSGAYAGLARLRPDVTRGTVEGALNAVARQLDEEAFGNRGLRLWSVPLGEDLTAGVRPVLGALLGASLFLLLTLGANLAALLFARASSRSRDVAVRSALGAGRWLSVMDLMSESVLISLAGGALGLMVTPLIVNALLGLAPPSLPRIEAIGVDASVIAITFVVVTILAFSAVLGPALRVSGRRAWDALRSAGPRAGGSADAARTRSVLVAVQVALSLVLLVSASLVARGVAEILDADPGFSADGVLAFRVPVPNIDDPGAERAGRFHTELRDALNSMPGVESSGATDAVPLVSGANQTSVTFPNAPGNTGNPDLDNSLIDYFSATPGYLETMRIGLLEGRSFDTRDVQDGPSVAIIDETLARRFFPGGQATGRTVVMNTIEYEIIGVVRHARLYSVFADDRGQVYRPLPQLARFGMYHVLRTSADPQSLIEPARERLRSLDATVPMAQVTTMRQAVNTSLGQHRLSLVLIAGFAFGALVLAAMGIYGVVSNSVLRRRHEFGVRLALGADRPGILSLVFAQGVRVVGAGVVAGLLGAIMAARLLASVLFGVDAGEMATYAAVGAFLSVIGLLACFVPAWRATRIAPVEALRSE